MKNNKTIEELAEEFIKKEILQEAQKKIVTITMEDLENVQNDHYWIEMFKNNPEHYFGIDNKQ